MIFCAYPKNIFVNELKKLVLNDQRGFLLVEILKSPGINEVSTSWHKGFRHDGQAQTRVLSAEINRSALGLNRFGQKETPSSYYVGSLAGCRPIPGGPG